MLNELDQELAHREHKFVRYADDIVILCHSLRSAERASRGILSFIEDRLFLKVNREKSQVVHVSQVK